MKVELVIDDGKTLLQGEAKYQDDSFDHEFGTERLKHLEIEDFWVITLIDGDDVDVTNSLKEGLIEYLKDQLLQHARLIFEDAG